MKPAELTLGRAGDPLLRNLKSLIHKICGAGPK